MFRKIYLRRLAFYVNLCYDINANFFVGGISMETIYIKAFPLDASFVERGTISKQVVNQESKRETSLLILGPRSKILDHSHPEKEVFQNILTGETLIYESGEKHGLENTTCAVQIWVSDKYLL